MRRTLLYVAYPMRLDLSAANGVQTYNTVRELRRVLPGVRLVVPRWLREPSAFVKLGALHLPRPAINKLSRIVPWGGWSYLERTVYAWGLAVLLAVWGLSGRGYPVLYVRDAVCAAWLALFRPLHRAVVIYEVHDLEASHPTGVSRWPAPLWARFLPWLDGTALQRAHMLVSLTDTFKAWAVSVIGRDPSTVAVIPDAYDAEVYYPRDRSRAREQLGLPATAFIVGYGGLTFAYRRLDLLVAAFARLHERENSAILVLVGGRPDEVTEVREQARALGLPDAALLTPGSLPADRNALFLSACDVLVIPDTVTGMTASPLKLFEYIALGKPVVARDMPALREIIDESCAVFFPQGDVEALATALEMLRSDPELVSSLAAAARERAAGYSYRARACKIAEVVRQCLTS